MDRSRERAKENREERRAKGFMGKGRRLIIIKSVLNMDAVNSQVSGHVSATAAECRHMWTHRGPTVIQFRSVCGYWIC